jgi:oligopeptide/dipeptide ABC transporter ATP-binding protein
MIQAQILDLLQNLQSQLGLSVVLVTHDLGEVAELCDDVMIMYGGKVAEYGDVDTIFNLPKHPYTQRLLEAFPDVNTPLASLASIPGYPPPLNKLPPGCRFEPRCHLRTEHCVQVAPPLRELAPADQKPRSHLAACHYAEPESTAVSQGLNYDS